MSPGDGRVISNFIIQALYDRPLTIYGDGSQTRAFCYRDDLARGLLALMDTADDFTGPVNLGNPGEFTVLELAQKIIALTGSNSEITFKPLPQNDPRKRKPNISLAKEVLGWEPKVALEEGLKQTIAYFEHLRERQDLRAYSSNSQPR